MSRQLRQQLKKMRADQQRVQRLVCRSGRAETGTARPRRCRAMVMSLLVLGLVSSTAAETVHCTTREDRAFNRLITTCSDGSKAITRYDSAFKRWVTIVTRPGEASKAALSKPGHHRR